MNKKGITLISLVVTIVVLLILAGISLSLILGNNGIIKKNNDAKERTIIGQEKEAISLAYGACKTETAGGPIDSTKLQNELQNNGYDTTVTTDFTITFNKTNHVYHLDEDGTVQETQVGDSDDDNQIDLIGSVSIGIDNYPYFTTKDGQLKVSKEDLPKGDWTTFNMDNSFILVDTKGTRITKVFDTACLDSNGKVYTWGINDSGTIGNGTKDSYNDTSVCISDIPENPLHNKKIVDLEAYSLNVYALDDQGILYSWGHPYGGALGTGDNNDGLTPTAINNCAGSALKDKKVVKFSIGRALDSNGDFYTWGYNDDLDLGNCKDADQFASVPICLTQDSSNPLYNKKIIDYNGDTVIDSTGLAYSWGPNSNGEIGDGTTNNNSTPICINNVTNSCLNGTKITKFLNIDLVDSNGNVYVRGNSDNHLPTNLSNSVELADGSKIIGDYQEAILLDSTGNVFIIDPTDKSFKKINNNGNSISRIENINEIGYIPLILKGLDNDYYTLYSGSPEQGISINKLNSINVFPFYNKKIVKLTLNDNYVPACILTDDNQYFYTGRLADR